MDAKISKTQVAISHFQKGDVKRALSITSQFRIGLTPEDRKVLRTGYECIVHPDFFQQLGKDVKECVKKAMELFQQLFIKERE